MIVTRVLCCGYRIQRTFKDCLKEVIENIIEKSILKMTAEEGSMYVSPWAMSGSCPVENTRRDHTPALLSWQPNALGTPRLSASFPYSSRSIGQLSERKKQLCNRSWQGKAGSARWLSSSLPLKSLSYTAIKRHLVAEKSDSSLLI